MGRALQCSLMGYKLLIFKCTRVSLKGVFLPSVTHHKVYCWYEQNPVTYQCYFWGGTDYRLKVLLEGGGEGNMYAPYIQVFLPPLLRCRHENIKNGQVQ